MNHEELRAAIQDIYDRRGGRDLDRSVLEEAVDPTHPLHEKFVWENEEAAEKYRLQQARGFIRSVKISVTTDDGDNFDVRQFHAFRRVGIEGRGYVSDSDVRQDPMQQHLLLQSLKRDWASAKRRYGELDAFWELVRVDLEGRDGLSA